MVSRESLVSMRSWEYHDWTRYCYLNECSAPESQSLNNLSDATEMADRRFILTQGKAYPGTRHATIHAQFSA